MNNNIVTPRLIRSQSRMIGNRLKEEMRSNLMYLVKPRPRCIPKFVWVWMLKRFLNLPKKNERK